MKATLDDLLIELWLRNRNSGELVLYSDNGDYIPIKNMSDKTLRETIEKLKDNGNQNKD